MLAGKLGRGAGGGGAAAAVGAGSRGWASSPRPGPPQNFLHRSLERGEDGHLWTRPAESARGLVHQGERVGYEAAAFGEH